MKRKEPTESQPPESQEPVAKRFLARESGEQPRNQKSITPAWNQLEIDIPELFEDYYTKFGNRHIMMVDPNQENFQDMASVDRLFPQLPNPSTCQFQTDSRNTISSNHNKNLAQINYGRGMVMKGDDPDHGRPRRASYIQSEIDLNPAASVAHNIQNVSHFFVRDIPVSFSPNPPTEQHDPGFGFN